MNRLADSPIDARQLSLSRFSADQLLETLYRLPSVELVNTFLDSIAGALFPDTRVDLFCKLPPLMPVNKFQLVQGINFSHLSDTQKQALKPLLYTELQKSISSLVESAQEKGATNIVTNLKALLQK